MNHTGLYFAIDKETSVIRHISDVPRGLDCNCICPNCNSVLVAKKGNKQIHHFAHYNAEVCKHGYETSIHLFVKDVLLNCHHFVIPPHNYAVNPTKIEFNSVVAEQRYKDIIPDITATIGNKMLFIEVHVFNAVDKVKQDKIRQYGISTLEIDVRGFGFGTKIFNPKEFANKLVNSIENKHWIYNSHYEREKKRQYQARQREKQKPIERELKPQEYQQLKHKEDTERIQKLKELSDNNGRFTRFNIQNKDGKKLSYDKDPVQFVFNKNKLLSSTLKKIEEINRCQIFLPKVCDICNSKVILPRFLNDNNICVVYKCDCGYNERVLTENSHENVCPKCNKRAILSFSRYEYKIECSCGFNEHFILLDKDIFINLTQDTISEMIFKK